MPAAVANAVPIHEAKPREVKPLLNGKFMPLGYLHNCYSAIAPAGTTRDDLAGTNPPLWSVVIDKIRAFDMIHVIDEGDTFFAQVLVRANDPSAGLEMILMSFVPLPPRASGVRSVLPPGTEIEYVPSSNTYQPWFLKPERLRAGEQQSTWEAARQLLVTHARFRKD